MCLVPLGGRVGVPYDTPADAVGGPTEVGVHPGGANGDVELEIAVGWDGADRAGVEATGVRSRSAMKPAVDLGRSGDRCREGGGEHIEEAGVGLHFDGGGSWWTVEKLSTVCSAEVISGRCRRSGRGRCAPCRRSSCSRLDPSPLEKFADDVGVVDRIGVARPSAIIGRLTVRPQRRMKSPVTPNGRSRNQGRRVIGTALGPGHRCEEAERIAVEIRLEPHRVVDLIRLATGDEILHPTDVGLILPPPQVASQRPIAKSPPGGNVVVVGVSNAANDASRTSSAPAIEAASKAGPAS